MYPGVTCPFNEELAFDQLVEYIADNNLRKPATCTCKLRYLMFLLILSLNFIM